MDTLTASLEWEQLLAACITIHTEIRDQDSYEFELTRISVWLCNANQKSLVLPVSVR